MWDMFWPIAMIVTANILYNICTKAVPGNVNAFASLFVTYLAASGASLALFFLTGQEKNLSAALARADWSAAALGLVIVALEFGYVAAYRAGWKISVCSLTANIALACALLLAGALLYREALSLRQALGAAVCVLGLWLVCGNG